MRARSSGVVWVALVGLLATVLPGRRAERSAGKEVFTVVGGDYISPLIISARAVQTLNAQSPWARFAGYDQLSVLVTAPVAEIVHVTRYSGELFSILAAEYVLDGRAQVSGNRVFISEAYWKRSFGGSADIIGQRFEATGEVYEIAGVVRSSSPVLGETDAWVPICARGRFGGMTALRVIGELSPNHEWRAGEVELGKIVRTAKIREQMVDLTGVHLLPVERKLVLNSSASEQFADIEQWPAKKPKRAA